jgi:small subunit ribosomal protein S16
MRSPSQAAERIIMATVIRMKRGGSKGQPYYRIVVQDSRNRTRGRELDILGYYHPTARPEPVSEINVHRALDWLGHGAQMSDTARSVMSKLGVLKHFHDGTRPEDAVATRKGEAVVDKGYNAPPPPKADKPAPAKKEAEAVEAASEEATGAAEETAEAAPEEVADTPEETTETAAEETPAEEA